MTNLNGCRRALLAGLLSCCLSACNSFNTVGSRFVKHENVTAAQGLTISVAANESPELAGTALQIPAGALAENTTITLEIGSTPLMEADAKSAGTVAIWGPAGTKFAAPVELTMPFTLAEGESIEDLFIQVREEDGARFTVEHSALTIDAANKLVRFSINGFTGFQPGTGVACSPNQPCAMGQACSNGQCKAACGGVVCGANTTCVNNQCQPTGMGCGPQGQQCAMGQQCINGACVIACGGVVCGANTTCVMNQCKPNVAMCGPNQPCAMGQVCNNGACVVACGGAVCAPNTSCINNQCQPNMPMCSPNQPCAMGKQCVNGACVTTCGGVVCGANTTCVNQQCQPNGMICNPNSPCPAGKQCSNGVCI